MPDYRFARNDQRRRDRADNLGFNLVVAFAIAFALGAVALSLGGGSENVAASIVNPPSLSLVR